MADDQETARGHHAPAYVLTIGGRDITPRMQGLLMGLTLTESRGDEADQLDIELDDSSGRVAIPPRGERIALRLGWQGQPLTDKGERAWPKAGESADFTLVPASCSAEAVARLPERSATFHRGRMVFGGVGAV